MALGIILMVLFGLLAVGILILIIGMLVLGIRRISKMGKPVEKQAPTEAIIGNSAKPTSPQEALPTENKKTSENPPQT